MSDLFSNKNVEEKVGGNGSNQKFIYGGIYHNIFIKSVEPHESSQKGTPAVRITMYTEEGGEDTARTFDFYMTQASVEMSKNKLKHIATKVNSEAAFNNIEANSLEDYCNQLNTIMAGRQLRMKFVAEQYRNPEGEVKDAARIGLPPFAEATQTGAHYQPVSNENTQLKYDKNNKYDYKQLDVTPDSEPATTTTTAKEDIFEGM